MGALEGEGALVPMRVTLFTAVAKLFAPAIKQLPDTRFSVLLGTTIHFQMPAD